MKRTLAFCAGLSVLSAAVALAAPPKKGDTKKTTAKVVDVWTCPMTGDKTDAAHQAGTPVVVGKYRMHFCCGGCPSAFAKLSQKDKMAKAVAAAKKDSSKTDTGKTTSKS